MGANESKGPTQTEADSSNDTNTSPNKKATKGTNRPVTPIDITQHESSYASKNEENPDAWKKSLKKGDIPNPVPQTASKDQFLHGIDFSIVDEHALKAPKSLLLGSFWDLVSYLTDDDLWDDLVRVRSIYRWITSYDIQNMDIDTTPPSDSPLEYFSKIQCDMGNLANLFYILCTMAEVPCKVIDGITKNSEYVLGKSESTDMKAQWNAVYVQNEWRLLDIFWAKSCVHINSGEEEEQTLSVTSVQRSIEYHSDATDDEYFFTDAHQLIWTHLPDDDKWQLLKDPISMSDFLDTLYVRERSRELDIEYTSKKLVYKIVNGQAEFKLRFPTKRGINYHFKHNFSRLLQEGETLRKLDKIIHHFILFERHDDYMDFFFNIPVLGKFRCNIFACDPNVQELNKFDLICSFLVVSTELSKECLPMPDYPKIGWGPNRISRRHGLIPITHEESSIYTSTGKVDIRVKGNQKLKLEIKLVNPFVDSANMSKYVLMYWNQGEYIVKTRLPRYGIYGLKYFTRNDETMDQDNVLNYLIHFSMDKGEVQCLPHIAQDALGPHPGLDRLGVAATMHENGYIEAKEGHTKVEFITKQDVELVGELHSNDPDAVPRMRVLPYKKNNKQTYNIDVPVKGEYAFNVYAFQKDEPHILNNAYAFLINSHGRHIDVGTLNNKTLENSKNFWKNTKHVTAESIVTTENEISIPVPRELDSLVAFLQKSDKSEPQNSESIQLVSEKGIDIYKVILDDLGDYTFNIYQQDHKFLKLVATYIITRNDHREEIEEDVKEVLEIIKEERENCGTDVSDLERHINGTPFKSCIDVDKRIEAAQQLATALKSDDIQQIKKAISEYQYNKPEGEDSLLKQGIKKLKKLEAKYDLLRAYKGRQLTDLERTIAVASALNEDRTFDAQLTHAKRLRDRLAAVRTMQDIVRNTDNRVVGEIRQYNVPPEGVHQTVMAALMLLGHDLSEVKTWKQCQKILGQHGEKSFLTQMSKFDPKDANLSLAVEAKKTIEPYTSQQIHTESSGAASIFIWAESMIKEIESNAGTLGVNKMVPEHTQAVVELHKPAKPSKESPPPEKRKGKAGPTLVTMEYLLIESPIPVPTINKTKKQNPAVVAPNKQNPAVVAPNKQGQQKQTKTTDKALNSKQPDSKDKKVAAKTSNDKNSNQKNPQKTPQKTPIKDDSKDSKSKATKQEKNTEKVAQAKKNEIKRVNKIEKTPRDETPKEEKSKQNTNFIAKNVQTFKRKDKTDEEDEDDNISSYLSNYHKKQSESKQSIDDSNSVDGHLSIPSNTGKPQKLVGGSYHGQNINEVLWNGNMYENDLGILGDQNNDLQGETPDQDKNSKKCYKAIYARRKDEKQAIEKLWANSVKAK